MTSLNQSESRMQVDNTDVPSVKEKTIASNAAAGVKDPLKLIIEMLYYASVFIPFLVWAILSHFFTRRKSIRNNVVMVTGAGRGLGRSLAMKFAELECNVACVDIDDINNAETVRLITQNYPSRKAIAYKCNVALVDDIKCLSKNIYNDLGEVDIIVNNAGIVSGMELTNGKSRLGTGYFDVLLDVNLKSHFLIISEFIPKMIERNSGHIVAIASLAGLNGLSNAATYSATKHGVIGLMESLYDELQNIPDNKIQTTCICPYFIATSEHYSKLWNLRLPELSVEKTTEAAINAIRRNRRIVAVPSYLYYISYLMKFLPDNLRNLQKKIFYTNLIPSAVGVGPCLEELMKTEKYLKKE